MSGSEMYGTSTPNGAELFTQLFRLLPLIRVEDYFQNGRWLMQRLEVDTELLVAHRHEAGAPEPLPSEELTLPEMPLLVQGGALPPRHPAKAMALRSPSTATKGAATALTPAARKATVWKGATKVAAPAPALPIGGLPVASPTLGFRKTVPQTLSTAATAAARGPTSPTATVGSSAATTASRVSTGFIEKWGLDPVRTKLSLARLSPTTRQLVMENFTLHGNEDGTMALQRYIREHVTNGGSPAQVHGQAAARAFSPKVTPHSAAAKRPISSVDGDTWREEQSLVKRQRVAPGLSGVATVSQTRRALPIGSQAPSAAARALPRMQSGPTLGGPATQRPTSRPAAASRPSVGHGHAQSVRGITGAGANGQRPIGVGAKSVQRQQPGDLIKNFLS